MNKITFFKIFEYAYLVIFFFSAYEVYNVWSTDRNRAYLFLVFAVVSIGMFLFRRNYRKKFEKHHKSSS